MSQAIDQRDAIDVSRLLAGAAKTVASARYCWLATATDAGPPRLRPMGRVLGDPGEDEWTIRFLTDGRSHKVGEMRRANEVAIVFQHDPDLAFVTLIGKATIHDNALRGSEPLETRVRRLLSAEAVRKGEFQEPMGERRRRGWVCWRFRFSYGEGLRRPSSPG